MFYIKLLKNKKVIGINASPRKGWNDYSQMEADMFDAKEIEERHKTVFPEDEKNCYELGKRLVEKAIELNKHFSE